MGLCCCLWCVCCSIVRQRRCPSEPRHYVGDGRTDRKLQQMSSLHQRAVTGCVCRGRPRLAALSSSLEIDRGRQCETRNLLHHSGSTASGSKPFFRNCWHRRSGTCCRSSKF